MKEKSISFGIRIRKELVEKLDEIVNASLYLKSTRSELIESIIDAFFSSKLDHVERGEEFIVTKRKRENK